jgi:flagellar motor switch/type III secretory pathway protein FliN
MPASFRLAIALPLGRLQLPVAQARSLRVGDVLVFEQAFFLARGSGYVQVGTRRLHGCIDDDSGPLCLTLTSIEDTSVDEEFIAPHYVGEEDDEPVTDVFGHEPFDELSMALSVRCGTLNLTLGELRNLAPGAVLGIAGYAPGMAGLYYGDRPIGQGQLVEIDGRLGLQRNVDPDVLTHLLENTARLWPAKMAQEVQREDLILLVPAFVLSQLQAGFEIGFLIYIPFIVIDLIVSNLLLALGMQMVSPMTISLPLKLLLFVMVSGWSRLLDSLFLSYL